MSDHQVRPALGEASRGSALILAIFTLALLTSMGLALLSLGEMEMRLSQGNLQVKKSFFLAEAGEEDARLTLFAVNGNGGFDDDLAIVAGVDGVIDFDPDNFSLQYDSQGNVTGITGFDDDFPLRPLQAFGEGWYAAFLSNDPLDGPANTTDTNNRVMITGIGASGDRSVEVVQAIVEKRPILPTLPPATITLLGPSPDYQGVSTDPFTYAGDDCPGGIPGLYVPVVGTVGSAAEAAAETGIKDDASDTYASGGYADEATIADLTDPSEPTVVGSGMGTLDTAWQQCSAIQQIIDEMRESATHTCCTPPTCNPAVPATCTMPAASPDNLIFIDGNFTLQSSMSGSGTLVVTGELTVNGGVDWNGLILVLGDGDFFRTGAGAGRLSGGIVVANIAGPDLVYGTADDCTGGSGGFSGARFYVYDGGNGEMSYCSTDISLSNPVRPYEVVSFRQR